MDKYKGVIKMDKDIVANYDNLYQSYRKSKSGKKFNGSTAKFSVMALDGINVLKEQLENRSYQISNYNEFEIFEPKRRLIKSCSFKDKVVQRCFSDYVLHPRLKNVFIDSNVAGQKNKGQHYGMDILKNQMLEFYHYYGMKGYILKCDIQKYFYNIDHEVLKNIVDYYFPDEFSIWLNHLFINSTENPGLPLGNQVAQIYALLMLDSIDKMITYEFGNRFYGRYNDDFYAIFQTKNQAQECLEAIQNMISDLKLKSNGKTQIFPFKMGICYLGFHHYVTEEGKYIRKLRGDRKRKTKARILKQAKLVRNGKMSEENFKGKYNSWKNHALHGNCVKLCHSTDLMVNEILNNN